MIFLFYYIKSVVDYQKFTEYFIDEENIVEMIINLKEK